MTPVHEQRIWHLDGALNVRDLGGLATADGRRIRSGMLLRADGLHRLSAADLAAFSEIALRSVIDLRSSAEVERQRYPVERHPVSFHHVPIVDSSWNLDLAPTEDVDPAEVLYGAYRSMIDEGSERFAHAIEILAGAEALPAVFHCAAGKDRTGVLAALILGSIGVDRTTIIDDYSLSATAMEHVVERLRTDPDLGEIMSRVPLALFAAEPSAMERLLDDLDAAHGSLRGAVEAMGVAPDSIDRLADILLADG